MIISYAAIGTVLIAFALIATRTYMRASATRTLADLVPESDVTVSERRSTAERR